MNNISALVMAMQYLHFLLTYILILGLMNEIVHFFSSLDYYVLQRSTINDRRVLASTGILSLVAVAL